jgi:hypothetical protein
LRRLREGKTTSKWDKSSNRFIEWNVQLKSALFVHLFVADGKGTAGEL